MLVSTVNRVLLPLLDEGNGGETFQHVISGLIRRDIGEGQPLGLDDFAEHALHPVLDAVGRAHHDPNRAARTRQLRKPDW
jgi:hypothetical protein